MIGILGGMGTQAGLDFCDKLAKLNRGKLDQKYPMFVLYNKSNTPRRAENLKQYKNVLKELIAGCRMLEKNKCKFIVMPCNTAHYWHEDIQKKISTDMKFTRDKLISKLRLVPREEFEILKKLVQRQEATIKRLTSKNKKIKKARKS